MIELIKKNKWQLVLFSITFLTFFNTLNNDFTNWDDPYYVTENQLIKSITYDNIKQIFSQSFTGTYVPLSVLSFAIDYQIGGEHPFIYHFTNLLLHILNVLLVFYFIRKLIADDIKAFITALLFGVSSTQVESVAWITERKDLLYTLFYLISLLQYLRYKDEGKNKFLFYSISFFILSLFSKSQAVTLTLVLIIIDIFKKYDLKNIKSWIEKLPYFILSLLFGYIALSFSKSAYSEGMNFSFFERVILSGYAFIMYLFKILMPVNLSAIYPYPFKSGETSFIAYLFSLISICYLILIYISYKKNKYLFFGLLFFLINIVLMLQIFPVGIAYMADRFSYLASVGIFLLIAVFFNNLFLKFQKYKRIILTVSVIYIQIMIFNTILRNEVWANSIRLWNNTISYNPNEATAYINRGNALKKEKLFKDALADYSKAIEINPRIPAAFLARGVINAQLGNIQEAMKDYNDALSVNPDFEEAIINKANLYYEMKFYSKALIEYNNVLNINNKNYKAYIGRGNVKMQMKDNNGAVDDFSYAIIIKPDEAEIYYNRANLKVNLGDLQGALVDFDMAINYKTTEAQYYSNRGSTKFFLKDINGALADFNIAIKLNPQIADYYYNRGNAKLYSGDNNGAIIDYNQCLQINPKAAEAYHKRGYSHLQSGNKVKACEDFTTALQMGYTKAENEINKYCK